MARLDVVFHPNLLVAGPLTKRVYVLVDVLGGSTAALYALEDGFDRAILTSENANADWRTSIMPNASSVVDGAIIIDAHDAVNSLDSLIEKVKAETVFVGGLVNALPLAAQVATFMAREDIEELTFVCAGDGASVCAANVFVAGVLTRLLLDELNVGATLTDAAGIAINCANSYEDFRLALGASHRGRILDASGGENLVSACATYSMIGLVGAVASESAGRYLITPFLPMEDL